MCTFGKSATRLLVWNKKQINIISLSSSIHFLLAISFSLDPPAFSVDIFHPILHVSGLIVRLILTLFDFNGFCTQLHHFN